MKLLDDRQMMIGKTVKNVHTTGRNSTVVILFTDDTYAVLEAYNYDGSAEMEDSYITNTNDMLKCGIITQVEYDKITTNQRKYTEVMTKANELRKLAELKAKYEPEEWNRYDN